MSEAYICGYRVHEFVHPFTPSAVLFSNEKDNITVSMVDNALSYVLSIIAIQDPAVERFKRAKTVFSAIKLILMNQQPMKPRVRDIKIAIDVLEEITNMRVKSEKDKQDNARYAFICRIIVSRFDDSPIGK